MTEQCIAQEQQIASESEERMIEYAISDRLVLAGQPHPQDWAKLARRGFRTIVNIRRDPGRAAVQAKAAEAVGLRYIHLPLPAYELEQKHLSTFNDIMNQASPAKTLLHCRSASRTGLLWMLKRIVHDGWSETDAEAELRAAGYQDENIDTFLFCSEDYFERTIPLELPQEATSAI